MKRPGRPPTSLLIALAVTGGVANGCSSTDVDWSGPSVGRADDGSLFLLGAPCSSTDLASLSIVDASNDRPVLRIEFDEPVMAWDVVVGLDPVDVDQPGFDVTALDGVGLAAAVASEGGEYAIVSEQRARVDGSTSQSVTPFGPAALPEGSATDFDVIVDDAAEVSCPRGPGRPWADVFNAP